MDTKKPLPAELAGSSVPAPEGPPPPYTAEAPSEPLAQAPSYGSLERNIDGITQQLDSQHLGPQQSSAQRLQRPIAIPATSKKTGSPFTRAYPPDLYHFAIPKEVFLHFVDELNKVAVASPPLQVLGLAGTAVSFVPIHPANIIGGSINAAAKIGTKVVSKAGTEIYLRKANKEIFGPRGLKVEIAKTRALAVMADIPILTPKGKVKKKLPIMPPMDDGGSSQNLVGQERRLKAFEPYIAPLEMTSLPEVESSKNPLSKLNSAASERQRKKEEKKLQKSHEKQKRKHDKKAAKREAKFQREMAKLDDTQAKMEQNDTESAEVYRMKVKELNRRRAKRELNHDARMAKGERMRNQGGKEVKGIRNVLWLVIRNVDADSGAGPDPYTDDHMPSSAPSDAARAGGATVGVAGAAAGADNVPGHAAHHQHNTQRHRRRSYTSSDSSDSDSSSSSSSSSSDSDSD